MLFTRKLRTTLSFLLVLLMLTASSAALAAPTPTPLPTLPPLDELTPEYDENDPASLTVDQLYAQSAILINENTGEVLLEKAADTRMNPASTTKIMTILLALEYGDVNSVVTIPAEAADIPKDSSVVPVTVGEEMTFTDLLYGFMLKSGNDAGNAIAALIGGSVESFVDMMNQRAEELGCFNTHFVNPHGYTAEGHYTTARDMARITQEAMKYPLFRKIVSAGEYTMNASNMRGEMVIRNSNLLLVWGSEFRYRYATGVKTGTTSAAGQCLVGSATKDGINLISVVFKSTVVFPHAKWQDTTRLMEYGFAQYETYHFQDLYEKVRLTVPVSGAAEGDASGGMIGLNALINRSGSYETTILRSDLDKLLRDFQSRLTVEYTADLVAPIEEGTIIGKLTFTPETGDVITALLVSDRSVTAAPAAITHTSLMERIQTVVPGWLLMLIAVFVLMLIVVIVSRSIVAARRRKRQRLARERARRRAAQARKRAQLKGGSNRPRNP